MSLLPRLLRTAARTPLLARAGSSSAPSPVQFIAADISPRTAGATVGQSPNVPKPWSTNQNPKQDAWDNARSEQVYVPTQPDSQSAMGLLEQQPIVMVAARDAVCDGGGGPLGHPKIFINLDKPGPRACGYCGTRYEQEHHH